MWARKMLIAGGMRANIRKHVVHVPIWAGLPLAAHDLVDEWLLEEACEPSTRARPSADSFGELARTSESRHPSHGGDRPGRHFGFSLDREIERWHREDRAGLAP